MSLRNLLDFRRREFLTFMRARGRYFYPHTPSSKPATPPPVPPPPATSVHHDNPLALPVLSTTPTTPTPINHHHRPSPSPTSHSHSNSRSPPHSRPHSPSRKRPRTSNNSHTTNALPPLKIRRLLDSPPNSHSSSLNNPQPHRQYSPTAVAQSTNTPAVPEPHLQTDNNNNHHVIDNTNHLRDQSSASSPLHLTSYPYPSSTIRPHHSSAVVNRPEHPSDENSVPTFQCTSCPARFLRKHHLERHVQNIHEGQRPWRCDQCGFSFHQKPNLERHILTVHEEQKPFRCDVCAMSFGRKGVLKKHIQMVHEQARKFECEICTIPFGLKSDLKRHVQSVHQKKRPFVCQVCSASFGRRSDLKRHTLSLHPGAELPPNKHQRGNNNSMPKKNNKQTVAGTVVRNDVGGGEGEMSHGNSGWQRHVFPQVEVHDVRSVVQHEDIRNNNNNKNNISNNSRRGIMNLSEEGQQLSHSVHHLPLSHHQSNSGASLGNGNGTGTGTTTTTTTTTTSSTTLTNNINNSNNQLPNTSNNKASMTNMLQHQQDEELSTIVASTRRIGRREASLGGDGDGLGYGHGGGAGGAAHSRLNNVESVMNLPSPTRNNNNSNDMAVNAVVSGARQIWEK